MVRGYIPSSFLLLLIIIIKMTLTDIILTLVAVTAVALAVDENVAGNDMELAFQPAQDVYRQGETVTLVCTVRNVGPIDVIQMVKTVAGREEEVSTNNVLKPQFTETGRYSIEQKTEENSITVTMEIKDIQGADAGRLTCRHKDGMTGTENDAIEMLKVIVPPKSVELLRVAEDGSLHRTETGEVVQMELNKDGGIVCSVTVEGVVTAPTVDITLGDDNIRDRFTMREETTDVNNGGLLDREYDVQYEHRTSAHNVDDNGKRLTCTATMDQFEPVSTYIDVEILYAPQADCQIDTYAKLEDAEVVVSCAVKMYPAPDMTTLTWGQDPDVVTLQPGEADDDMRRSFDVVQSKDTYEFKFVIKDVAEGDFIEYNLETSNSIGSGQWTLELKEEFVPTEPPILETTKAPTIEEGDSEGQQGEEPPKPVSGAVVAHVTSSLLALGVLLTALCWSRS